jgi:hypothetical protein
LGVKDKMEYTDQQIAEIAQFYHIYRSTYQDFDPRTLVFDHPGEIAKHGMKILYTSAQELKSRTTPELRRLLGIREDDLQTIEGICGFFSNDPNPGGKSDNN